MSSPFDSCLPPRTHEASLHYRLWAPAEGDAVVRHAACAPSFMSYMNNEDNLQSWPGVKKTGKNGLA